MAHFFHRVSLYICILLTASAALRAQDYDELRGFEQASGSASILYRGKTATRYLANANGTYYWSTKKYGTGDIVFEGRRYDGVEMNIDAIAQEVLVRLKGTTVEIALPTDKVDSLTIDGTGFVNIRNAGDGMPAGLYEILHRGSVVLYRNVAKLLHSSTTNVNGKLIGYDDPNYNTKFISFYEYSPSYYLLSEDGSASRIKSKSALVRCFPDKKKALNRFIRANELLGPNVSFEEFSQKVLQYGEQL